MKRTVACVCAVLALGGCKIPELRDVLAGGYPGDSTVRPNDGERGQEPPAYPTRALYDETEVLRHTTSLAGADFDADVAVVGGELYLTFASTRHSEQAEIYVKPVNKPSVRRLTNNNAQDVQPHFSPDGKYISYASDRNGNWDIFITSAKVSGSSWQVTQSPHDDVHPSWSPDGRKLAYSSRSTSGEWDLWIRDLVTDEQVNLGPGLFPEWSPTGKRLAFQRATSRGPYWYGVWAVDSDGNNLTEIVSDDNWAAINPSWSPDGQHLAFATVGKSKIAQQEGRVYNGDDVWIVDAEGSNRVQLTYHDMPDWNPTWGIDGRIYFSSDRERARNIWSVKPILFNLAGATARRGN